MYPKNHWPPSKSVQHPHFSRSPIAKTIWIPDDWSVFSRLGWRPGTVCGGGRTSGDVLVQSVLCCTLDSWPSHINQICRSSHMSKQHDKPRLLPGTHRTHCQHSVCVCVSAWVCVYFTRHSSRDFPSKDLLRHQKCYWHEYHRHLWCVL